MSDVRPRRLVRQWTYLNRHGNRERRDGPWHIVDQDHVIQLPPRTLCGARLRPFRSSEVVDGDPSTVTGSRCPRCVAVEAAR